jgi:hypothetical protein
LEEGLDSTQGGIPFVRIDGSHDSAQVGLLCSRLPH